jgi:hypothetical protein
MNSPQMLRNKTKRQDHDPELIANMLPFCCRVSIGQALLSLLVMICSVVWVAAQVVIPDARDGRVGGQLLYYFDMANHDVGYLTITNFGSSSVPLHIQLFGPEGESSAVAAAKNPEKKEPSALVLAARELLRFPVTLVANCTVIYDLRRFLLPNGLTVDLAGNKGFMTVTPVSSSPGNPAVPYNHLAGNTVHANVDRKNSFGLNAVARLAVDAAGNPLPDLSGVLDGDTKRFQSIQPARLYHDGFYALDTLSDSRVILISFKDNYSATGYLVSCGTAKINGFAGASDCSRRALPEKSFGCLVDIDMTSFLGGNAASFRQAPGFLELTTTYEPFQNLVGIASQTLSTFTVNRYLWGGM